MSKNLEVSHLDDLIADGHEVLTTIFDLGSAQIRLAAKNELSLISVSGVYSPKLAKEIEKVAYRCQGSIGLEFENIRGDPKSRVPQVFDSSVLTMLKNMMV